MRTLRTTVPQAELHCAIYAQPQTAGAWPRPNILSTAELAATHRACNGFQPADVWTRTPATGRARMHGITRHAGLARHEAGVVGRLSPNLLSSMIGECHGPGPPSLRGTRWGVDVREHRREIGVWLISRGIRQQLLQVRAEGCRLKKCRTYYRARLRSTKNGNVLPITRGRGPENHQHALQGAK